MKRRHYVLIRRQHNIPTRRSEDVPLRRGWVFHLRSTCDVTGTYRETSLRRRHDVLLQGGLLHFPRWLWLVHWATCYISATCKKVGHM